MKIETEIDESGFKPVRLTLTLETPNELLELYHRVNIRSSVFDEITYKGCNVPVPKSMHSLGKLFTVLADAIEAAGLLKKRPR